MISTLTLLGNWKKTVEHENDGCTGCNSCIWYSHKRIGKMTRGLGDKRTSGSGDHPNYSIIEIDQREDSWRLEETCYHLISSERPSANTDMKISQGVIIIISLSLVFWLGLNNDLFCLKVPENLWVWFSKIDSVLFCFLHYYYFIPCKCFFAQVWVTASLPILSLSLLMPLFLIVYLS